MVPMRYGSRYFFQSVIFASKTFSFMTNFSGYIPLDHSYISMKKFLKNSRLCPSYCKKRDMEHETRYGSETKLNL